MHGVSRLLIAAGLTAFAFTAGAGAEVRMGAGRGYSVEVADSRGGTVRLHAEEAGDGEPLLLIHGLGASTFTWRRLAPDFARRRRVVAIDLKGFGQSDKPRSGPYSADEQAALVAAFVRKRDLNGVTLIGHSFGGAVALLAALALRDEPGRVSRVVAIDAPAAPQAFPDVAAILDAPLVAESALAAILPEVAARAILTLSRAVDNPPPEEDIAGYAKPFYELPAKFAFVVTARSIVNENAKGYLKRLRALDAPVLLVWCRSDEIVPLATGRTLARTIPGARLKILRGCNHMPQDERPAALASVIGGFLR